MEQEQRPSEASVPWEPLRLPVERILSEDALAMRDELAQLRSLVADGHRRRAELLALFAVASHDLRTPINAIVGYNELLLMELHGPLTDAQRVALERVQASAEQLIALLSDTMSFARHEAGRLECRAEPVDISAVLREATSMARHATATRRVHFEVDAAEGLVALADRERALHILRALLTTSARFARADGRVIVDARLDGGTPRGLRSARAPTVRIIVSDDGAALSPAALECLFDPYAQAAPDGESSGAVGLGIAITRGLARAMGGDLSVDSVEGRGTTFELSLPCAG